MSYFRIADGRTKPAWWMSRAIKKRSHASRLWVRTSKRKENKKSRY